MRPPTRPSLKTVTLGFLILGLLGTVSAADSISIDSGDKEVWLNSGSDNTVNGEFNCSSGSIKVKKGSSFSSTISSSPFSFTIDSSVISDPYGGYSLECGGTALESFDVKELVLNWANPNEEKTVYQGRTFTAEVSAHDSDGGSPSIENSVFDSEFLGGSSLNTWVEGTSGGDTILKFDVPSDAEIGDKRLVTSVDYDSGGETVEAETSKVMDVNVQKPWKAEILNKNPASGEISYQELSSNISSMSVKVNVTRKGVPQNKLVSDDFYVEVSSENASSTTGYWIRSDKLEGDGMYRLTLKSLPSLSLGTYNFEILLDREGGSSITEFTVNRYIRLHGSVTDATGSPVNAQIGAEQNGLTRTFGVGSDGEYNIQLLPGDYNFTVGFSEVNARFNGVEMRQGVQGAIRYDDVPASEVSTEVEGVTIVNVAGIWFGYPFESSSLEMSYDPSRVSFERVRVLECQNWNLEGRRCENEWNSLNLSSGSVYPTQGRVEFEGNPVEISKDRKKMLNAYMVVRNTELKPEYVRINEDRVPVGTNLPVQGKVVTPKGTGVGGVNVEVSIIDGEETVSAVNTTTDASGVFGAQVPTPRSPGNYYVDIKAGKNPYQGFETRLDKSFATFIEKGVSIQFPDTVEFYPGQEAETRFTVINTGQTELQNVNLRINGLKNSWYNFSQISWSRIGQGGSREAVMTTVLPDDYCGDTCQEYPEFNVEAVGVADGDEVNSIESIQAVVTKEKDTGNQTGISGGTDDGATSLSSTVEATGEFLASQSSLNIALGLITIFLFSLAAAVKKKKNEDTESRRNKLSNISGGSPKESESRIQKPQVVSEKDGKEEPVEEESKKEESGSSGESQGGAGDTGGEQEADGEYVCGECGESFDSKAALELHKDINGE